MGDQTRWSVHFTVGHGTPATRREGVKYNRFCVSRMDPFEEKFRHLTVAKLKQHTHLIKETIGYCIKLVHERTVPKILISVLFKYGTYDVGNYLYKFIPSEYKTGTYSLTIDEARRTFQYAMPALEIYMNTMFSMVDPLKSLITIFKTEWTKAHAITILKKVPSNECVMRSAEVTSIQMDIDFLRDEVFCRYGDTITRIFEKRIDDWFPLLRMTSTPELEVYMNKMFSVVYPLKSLITIFKTEWTNSRAIAILKAVPSNDCVLLSSDIASAQIDIDFLKDEVFCRYGNTVMRMFEILIDDWFPCLGMVSWG